MKRIYILCIIFSILISCKKENNTKISGLSLLHAVRGDNPGIYDRQDRYILLRGAAYNSLGDYWQGNPGMPAIKNYDANDFADMAKFGMNCVRLVFHWSELEPERGIINYNYIDKIEKAIQDAARNNIYVVIDMHQDAWGKYIVSPPDNFCATPNKGWDGAPEWATLTDGESTCITNDFRESAPAVYHAFHNLWYNKDGISDHLIHAWQELVKRTCKYSNVAGYDLINEPGLGYNPLGQEIHQYSLFCSKLINAIRSAESEVNGWQHIIFFENTITWKGQAFPFIPDLGFTSENNMVFSSHNYFEASANGTPILTIEQSFDLYLTLAKLYNSVYWCGEWAFEYNPISIPKLKRYAYLEDKYFLGSTYWLWSATPGDPHMIKWDGSSPGRNTMLLIETNPQGEFTGAYNVPALNAISRTYPRAIVGKPMKLTSNIDDGTLHLEAKANNSGTTILWIPDRFGEPIINGDNAALKTLTKVNGGYTAEINVSGSYSVDVFF